MAVSSLNHVNIRTLDLAGTVSFYTTILGFRFTGTEIVNGQPRNWLYDTAGVPIIHLREMAPCGDGAGAVDHVALSCEDQSEVVSRMEGAGISYAIIDNLVDGITQIFLKDPNGVALELNFPKA